MNEPAKRRSQKTEVSLDPVSQAGFYRAFEDRFRGSRELIRSRLETYLPFINPLKQIQETPAAVDVGCGRGEWLQLLGEQGFRAQGVDLDDGMLESCRELGFDVTKEDALNFLRGVPDSSLAIVSGFHIAEHLPFDQLYSLVSEAYRVLMPGGLLILETPNPENLRVSTLLFYLDPTHRNPLPPDLLSFMAEYTGFNRIKVIRLQGKQRLEQASCTSLAEVLGGASPDYAVIAQKDSDAQAMAFFDGPFRKEYGFDASGLVESFDVSLNQQRIELDRLKIVAHELAAIRASTSWRITAPLRALSRTARWFLRGSWAWLTLKPGSRPRRTARAILVKMARFVLSRPKLARPVKQLLQRMPVLDRRLRSMVASSPSFVSGLSMAGKKVEDLSPRGRAIHEELSAAIEKRRRKD